MAGKLRATIIGTRELTRDLNAVEAGLGRAVAGAIAEAAEPIVREARALAPRGPGPQGPKDNLPHVADTIFASPAGEGAAAVRSTHPAAPVLEWGGTIAPRGTAIRIRRHGFVDRARDSQAALVGRLVDERLDRLIRQFFPTS